MKPWFVILGFLLTWGHVQSAERQKPLIKEFLGINGHTVQFKPELYRPICSLVRDYHPVSWDLEKDTALLPSFPQAKNKVDWSRVYGSWREKGWMINASLMFESIPRDQWKNLATDAKKYGREVAKHFGPSSKTPLLESVEIGNEPGKWSDEDYSTILKSMAEGIREGDPKLKIVSCNLSTGKGGDYEKSVSCLKGLLPLVDVLNVHSYAQLVGWPTWKRSYPEDPALKSHLPDIESLLQWRDKHCPDKPVWLTEFGYDSTTKPQLQSGDFAKWEGVSDVRQAQWLVRSALVFSAMPLDRAYIYFFNDQDEPKLHASAGLTRNFQPKPSYHALAHFQKTLGDYRFSRMIRSEEGKLRMQEYVHGSNPKKLIWVLWSPTGENRSYTQSIPNLPGKLVAAERMPFTPKPDLLKLTTPLTVEINESPLYLSFEK